jgi:hypothetical protein
MGQTISQRDIDTGHAEFLEDGFAAGREALVSFVKEMGMKGSVAEKYTFVSPIRWKTTLSSDQLKSSQCEAVKCV